MRDELFTTFPTEMVEVDERAVRPLPRTSSLGVRLQGCQNVISIGSNSITGDDKKLHPPMYNAYGDAATIKRRNRTMFSNSPTNLTKQDQESQANDHNAFTVSREKKALQNLCTIELMEKTSPMKSVRLWNSGRADSPTK